MITESPFPGFWMAGFECATQIHRNGRGRLDLTAEMQHDAHCDHDYSLVTQFGLRTVRDGIRWHLIERRAGHYDFGSVEPLLRAAERHGVQVIWDIYHYGTPDDIDPLHPHLPDRFAAFARAFARYIREHTDAVPIYAPINEISYLAWAVGQAAIFHPFRQGEAGVAKRNLVRAEIAGIEAIRSVDPRARIVHTDPLIHTVAPADRPDLIADAEARNESQFEALEMLVGRQAPELGGSPRYLDILGFNFYPYNQEYLGGGTLTRADPGWVDLSELLARAYARYERPFFISETSAEGAVRGPWLEYVAGEAQRLLRRGLPLLGICLYPVTTSPDWDTGEYKAYGLWDLERQADGSLRRALNVPYAETLRSMQAQLRPFVGDPWPERHHPAPGSLAHAVAAGAPEAQAPKELAG